MQSSTEPEAADQSAAKRTKKAKVSKSTVYLISDRSVQSSPEPEAADQSAAKRTKKAKVSKSTVYLISDRSVQSSPEPDAADQSAAKKIHEAARKAGLVPDPKEAAAEDAAEFEVGQKVVVVWAKGEEYEGKVKKVNHLKSGGYSYHIAYKDGAPTPTPTPTPMYMCR